MKKCLPVKYFSAVLICSKNAERLFDFYKNKLHFPLVEEQHGESLKHYGCEMGDLHFAIHPVESFGGVEAGVGAVKLAFEVFDIYEYVRQLKTFGVDILYPVKEMGPMLITAIHDPDGNLVEFTQLGASWMTYLAKRRDQGHDLLSEYKKLNSL